MYKRIVMYLLFASSPSSIQHSIKAAFVIKLEFYFLTLLLLIPVSCMEIPMITFLLGFKSDSTILSFFLAMSFRFQKPLKVYPLLMTIVKGMLNSIGFAYQSELASNQYLDRRQLQAIPVKKPVTNTAML